MACNSIYSSTSIIDFGLFIIPKITETLCRRTVMLKFKGGGYKVESSIPEFLIEKLKKEYGEELTKAILNGYLQQRNTTIRVNTIKTNLEKVKHCLTEAGIKYEITSWNENALILSDNMEEKIQLLGIYKDGEIYMQSLSSMLPTIVLNPRKKENILDMCAAPRWQNYTISFNE